MPAKQDDPSIARKGDPWVGIRLAADGALVPLRGHEHSLRRTIMSVGAVIGRPAPRMHGGCEIFCSAGPEGLALRRNLPARPPEGDICRKANTMVRIR